MRSAVKYAGQNGWEMTISASGSSRSKTELGPSLSDVTTRLWPWDSRGRSDQINIVTQLIEVIYHCRSSTGVLKARRDLQVQIAVVQRSRPTGGVIHKLK